MAIRGKLPLPMLLCAVLGGGFYSCAQGAEYHDRAWEPGRYRNSPELRHGWLGRADHMDSCSPGYECAYQPPDPTHRFDGLPALAGLAVAAGALFVGNFRLQGRLRLLARGVPQESALDPAASYRAPPAPPALVLPPVEVDAAQRRLALALVPWLLGLAVVATAGDGHAPLPMPWTMALWGAATLPTALTSLRWVKGAGWAPVVLVLSAAMLGLSGEVFAAAPCALVGLLCAWCAWQQEAHTARPMAHPDPSSR